MADNKFQTPEALARCLPMSRLQAVLSGKWKILILWYVAFYRVQRFGALLRRLDGITQSTLTRQLRELEADGFLHREVYPEVPPRVEYTLTAMGESFLPVLKRSACVTQKSRLSDSGCVKQSGFRRSGLM